MSAFLTGLKNYRTTLTGITTLVFVALGQAYPAWAEFFNKAAEATALVFVILTKDASTGSTP
jgi:hypothetical protein